MSKLTNRSQIYLKKIKAQYGDFINDSVHYLQNPAKKQEVPEDKGFSLADNLPVIGAGLQVLGGIKSLFESDEQRRIQQTYEREYAKDLKERKEQSRANSFYLTPYTTNRTSNLTAKKGLKVPIPFYQNGGQMDLFMDFYNQQEQSKKQALNYLTDTYADRNEQRSKKVDEMQSSGLSDLMGGAMGLASAFKKGGFIKKKYQEGAEVEGIPESEDLYSENFVSPYEIKEQVENELKTESPGEEMQGNSNLMSWLFSEEPLETYTVSDIYDAKYSKPVSQGNTSDIPIRPVIDQFSSMGIQVGSINTGVHNRGSLHPLGKAFDVPGSKNGGKEGLYKIYNYLNSPEGKRQFPNIKVLNEIEKPAGKIGDANHLHIELLD